MAALPGLIRTRIGTPRGRVVVVVLLLVALLVVLALALHMVGMADHGMLMLGACMAVLAAVALPAAGTTRIATVPGPALLHAGRIAAAPEVFIPGRHPPDEGTVLLS